MIAVVDYGVGNLASICNMLDFIGVDCFSSSDPDLISKADGLILPGVGSFDDAMSSLRDSDIIPCLEDLVFDKHIPLLGVCLGMQILGISSAEGSLPGLGWIDASCKKIDVPAKSDLKVPNNGWRSVTSSKNSRLFKNIADHSRYYFNHSYVMTPSTKDIAATFEYQGSLCCSVESKNIFGVQFHPEKSHSFGMNLLAEFARLTLESTVC